MKNNSISLEALVSGFSGSDLIIIGSRPGMGKTSLALTLAAQMAYVKDKAIAFFSLEMSKDALFKRLSLISDIDPKNIQKYPFHIFDSPQMTISELEQQIRDLQSRQNIQAVFIDYLGLLSSDNFKEPRQKQQNDIIIRLKALSRELNIVIIAVNQLRRDSEPYISQTYFGLREISSEETLQCIDKLLLIEKSDTQKPILKVHERSQNKDWINEEIQWTIPV